MHETLIDNFKRNGLTRILPLYVAAYAVLLCGLGAYLSTYEDETFGSRGLVVVLIGLGVSLFCRWRQMKQNTMFGILAAMVVVLLFWVSVTGQTGPGEYLTMVASGRNSGPGFILAWFLILYSFAMITDEVIIFSVVPSIALLGLMASDNLNPEIVIYFLGLVVSAVFLLVYENMLSRAGADALTDVSDADSPASDGKGNGSIEPAVRVSLLLTSVVAVLALIVGFAASLPLSYLGQTLSDHAPRINLPAATEFANTVTSRYIDQIQLDGAPPRLTDRVVMQIQTTRPFYWRSKVFPRYTGFSWTSESTPREILPDNAEKLSYLYGNGRGYYGGYGGPGGYGGNGSFGTIPGDHPADNTQDGISTPANPGATSREIDGRREPQQSNRVRNDWFRARRLEFGSGNLPIFSLRNRVAPDEARARKRVRQHVRLIDPPMAGMLVSAAEPDQFEIIRRHLMEDADRGISVPRGRAGMEYQVDSLVSVATPEQLRRAGTRYPVALRSKFTQLEDDPGSAPAERHEIAARITAPYDNPYDKVLALEHYLQENYLYTLTPPRTPRSEDAVTFFLTQSRQGYCEIFASSMAVLAREVGIPARLATGFAPGEWQPEHGGNAGTSVVREKDLHAWTEVFFPGYGWIPFDPTSSREAQTSWTSSLKDFLRSMISQVARHRAGPTLVLLMLFGIVGFVLKAYAVDPLRTSLWWRSWWAGHRRDLSPDQRWDLLYVRVHRRLKRWAGLKAAHQTPYEYAAQARPVLSPEAAGIFDRVTHLYVSRSFQRGGPEDADIRGLLELEIALRHALRHSPRPERAPRSPARPESASAPA